MRSEASAARAETAAPRSLLDTVRAYIALSKPRIIWLLLVTTVPAMVLAERGWPSTWLIVATMIGGTLAAGGANAINQVADRDIDELMHRTSARPLPTGSLTPSRALAFGLALGAISAIWLTLTVNLLAALLALAALGFYVLVYSYYLKRNTTQNIVLGGAAGAAPPVIGWAAVTGEVGIEALFLFLIVFYWTPPHFWALALVLSDDYERAGVPMLPVVRGEAETKRQIVLYTLMLIGLTLAFTAHRRSLPDLLRDRRRRRRGLPLSRHPARAQRGHRGRDAALPLLDRLPRAALRRGRHRRAGARLVSPALGASLRRSTSSTHAGWCSRAHSRRTRPRAMPRSDSRVAGCSSAR